METKIKFGILINLNINNKHHLEMYDRLECESIRKLDVYNYIQQIEGDYTTFSNEINAFKRDALWIMDCDGYGTGSAFYLVCYTEDENHNIGEVRKIKDLFY